MDGTVKLFLTARSWQVFLLLIGPIFVGSLVLRDLPDIFGVVLGPLIFMGVWMAWLWAIASASNRKLDESLRKSTKWMLIGLAYSAVYLMIFPFVLPEVEGGGGIPAFMIPMHLLAMAGIFYAFLFTANRLVTLERREKVSFFDYSGPFFLFWFFPVGVWFIQPRVNKLLGNDDV